MSLHVIAVAFLFAAWPLSCLGFNIDTAFPVTIPEKSDKFSRSEDSLFGFSLAFYNRYNWTSSRFIKGILVGAPTAKDRNYGNINTGILYFCPMPTSIDEQSICSPVIVDKDHRNSYCSGCSKPYEYVPFRHISLLGYTVVSQSEGANQAMVCAPRWIDRRHGSENRTWHSKPIPRYMLNGMCYVTPSGNGANRSLPWSKIMGFNHPGAQSTENGSVSVFSTAQSGFAATFLPDGKGAAFSAPGYWNGLGTVAHATLSGSQPIVKILNSSKALKYCQDEFNCYLGFSLAAGKLFGSEANSYFVSGMPKANSTGMVVVYKLPGSPSESPNNKFGGFLNETMDPVVYLKGEQYGETFGYSVIVLDLNSDGRDDIVVGAPNYHKTGSNVDEGAVYVFLTSSDKWKNVTGVALENATDIILEPDITILGQDGSGSRFGISLAKLGDINRDGFQDFAIGSPFGTAGGSVYIVYGGPSGYVKDFTARIASPDGNRGFGWSIAEGKDVDGNSINDVAVGNIVTESVYVFRGQPVLTWDMILESSNETLLVGSDKKSFFLEAYLKIRTNFSISERFYYTINVILTIDPADSAAVEGSHAHRRAVFASTNTTSWTWYPNTTLTNLPNGTIYFCREEIVVDFWEISTKQLQKPLTIEMQADIQPQYSSRSFCSTCPVLTPDTPKTKLTIIPFIYCLPEDDCQFNLTTLVNGNAINNSVPLKAIQGINSTILLHYDINNQDISFPLYSPKFGLALSKDMRVIKMETESEDGNTVPLYYNGTDAVWAWLPVGASQTLLPGRTVRVSVTLDVSGVYVDSADVPSKQSVVTVSIEYEPLAGVRNSSFEMTTILQCIPSFAVQVIANSQRALSEIKPNVENNDVTNPSELKFQLEFQIASTGSGTVPKGIGLQLNIPTGTSDRAYFAVLAIKFKDETSVSELDCSPTHIAKQHKRELSDNFLTPYNVTNSTERDERKTNADVNRERLGLTDVQKLEMDCTNNDTVCASFDCHLPTIPASKQISIVVMMEILPQALRFPDNQQGLLDIVLISSANVNKSGLSSELEQGDRVDFSLMNLQTASITTAVKVYFHNYSLPTWIIIAGVSAAVLILALIALVLWKTGFFRRPMMEDEIYLHQESSTLHVADDDDEMDGEQGGFVLDKDFQRSNLGTEL